MITLSKNSITKRPFNRGNVLWRINNCLEISQRARQFMIDMNEEIEPSLEKNFKYCSISIPPVAYTLIVIGAVPLLIYLFDTFYHLLI